MAVRVGVVGMGMMGELHARAYQGLPGCNLVGLVETDAGKREEAEIHFDVPVYEDASRLYEEVDAVSVCTPDHLHRETVIRAFDAGVVVLVEKPLAATVEDAREILARRPSPRDLMVGHILRFDLRFVEVRDRISRGELGEILHVRSYRANTLAAAEKLGSRVSVSAFLGVHDLDMIVWITGESIGDVSARGRRVVSENLDLVVGHYELSNGAVGQLETHWLLPNGWPRGHEASLTVVGTDGMATVDLSARDVSWVSGDAPYQELDAVLFPEYRGSPEGALARELSAFVDSVAQGNVPPVTGEDGLRAVRAVEQLERSLEGTG